METVFVKAVFDLECEWEGLPPSYRIYVNDEMFVERTWIWSDHYLQEILQIQAPKGIYSVRLEPLQPALARFLTSNHAVLYGPGSWLDQSRLEIQ